MAQPVLKRADFNIISRFNLGYRNREDKTNLKPGILIEGSQNVLTDTTGRVGITKGYELDGAASSVLAPILAAYDYEMHTGDIQHVRAGFLTTAGNDGKLQFRWVNSSGTPVWTDLMTGLTSVSFNFADYWDSTNFRSMLLFVNGTSNIFEWTGGVTTFASATATTLTKEGTTTWAEEGFYNNNTAIGDATTQFDITNPGGTTYRYTYDGTGTDPAITAAKYPVGMKLHIAAQNFNAANNGLFTVTGSGTNYFEVTNAAGVVESNKTIGTGFINYNPSIVVINGTEYAYSGGAGTTTLTNVTPNPSTPGYAAGVSIHQAPKTWNNSTITSLPTTLANSLISNLKNQIYIGSLVNNQVYVSKVNNFRDYGFTTPVRVVGEGAILTLDATPRAFIPQEQSMYISAGQDQWYETQFTLSSDLTKEELTVQRLKTTAQQGSQSQALTSKIKNNVVYVSNEPILNTLGRASNVVLTPQVTDISFPIVNDFNQYDFTNGCVFYFQKFVYVAIPQEGLIRIYNMTNSVDNTEVIPASSLFYWEAPLTIPVSRFSIIDGELYGHSYLTSESYKLFTGYNFNGAPIDARAIFSYMNNDDRDGTKSQNEFYVEGYISPNCVLNTNFNYELDGYAGSAVYELEGSNTQVVQIPNDSSSLGKSSLGKNPLGGTLDETSTTPPKFRVIWTFPRTPYFEFSPSFTSSGIDYNWSILAFGPQATLTTEGQNDIKI